MILVLLVE